MAEVTVLGKLQVGGCVADVRQVLMTPQLLIPLTGVHVMC